MQTSPWNVLSSQVALSTSTEGWRLDVVEPTEDSFRSNQVEVWFATPFLSPPVVQLGLTGFDLDQRDSPRLTLKAENITSTGFLATITTWADTRVYAVEFQWLAIGA